MSTLNKIYFYKARIRLAGSGFLEEESGVESYPDALSAYDEIEGDLKKRVSMIYGDNDYEVVFDKFHKVEDHE